MTVRVRGDWSMEAGVIDVLLQLIIEQPSWLAFGVVAILLYIVFMNPIKVMRFHALLAGLFEKLATRAARHTVAADIRSKVDSYVNDNHAEDILPYKLRFKWVVTVSAESYTEENDVIVVMDYKRNNDRNFVNAIIEYTDKGFLPDIRHDIPSKILTAAELVIQEKIIRSQRSGALSIFFDEVVPSQIGKDEEIKAFHSTLNRINMLGFFDNIWLNEILHSADVLRSMDYDERYKEMYDLAVFLETFWERGTGEDIPLKHRGRVFKLSVVLVAKSDKVAQGTDLYTKRVKNAFANNIKSVYVTGIRHRYDFIAEVIKSIKNIFPEKLVWVRTYKSHRRMKEPQNASIAFLQY